MSLNHLESGPLYDLSVEMELYGAATQSCHQHQQLAAAPDTAVWRPAFLVSGAWSTFRHVSHELA